jgi:hypothetical protein
MTTPVDCCLVRLCPTQVGKWGIYRSSKSIHLIRRRLSMANQIQVTPFFFASSISLHHFL